VATLTIRNFDPVVKAQIVESAKRNKRSMEAQIRLILENAITESAVVVNPPAADTTLTSDRAAKRHGVDYGEEGLGTYWARRFAEIEPGPDLNDCIPPRTSARPIPAFE